MKYITIEEKHSFLKRILKKKPDEKLKDLTSLDKAVLRSCKEPLRIQQILHLCKPYVDKWGTRKFATTEEIVHSVKKLVKLELLREVN